MFTDDQQGCALSADELDHAGELHQYAVQIFGAGEPECFEITAPDSASAVTEAFCKAYANGARSKAGMKINVTALGAQA